MWSSLFQSYALFALFSEVALTRFPRLINNVRLSKDLMIFRVTQVDAAVNDLLSARVR